MTSQPDHKSRLNIESPASLSTLFFILSLFTLVLGFAWRILFPASRILGNDETMLVIIGSLTWTTVLSITGYRGWNSSRRHLCIAGFILLAIFWIIILSGLLLL